MNASLHATDDPVPGTPEFRALSDIGGLAVELRYATPNNFVGRDLYSPLDCAWLHRDAAAALERSLARLKSQRPDCSLLVLDALRPQRVQEELWASLQGTNLLEYLAEPVSGSIPSFGMAIAVKIVDDQGKEPDTGNSFKEMNKRSHPVLEESLVGRGALRAEHLAHRRLLRDAMSTGGWRGINSELWHFDCGDRMRVRAEYRRVL